MKPNPMESPAKKAKILYLITKSNWGGAQKYVYELATSLPADSFDVSVGLGGDGELKTRLETAGIRTISIPSLSRDVNIFSDAKVLFNLLSLFRKERPDIVHVNSSKIGGLGAVAGRLAGVRKIIFTGHGWAFNENRSQISKSLIRFFSWLTIIFSHQTIVVSEYMKRQMDRLPLTAGKIFVIHNGIAPIDFIPRTEARDYLWKKSGNTEKFPEEKICIGTISELHSNKGLEFALEGLARLKNSGEDFLFFIIGEGEQRKELEARIKKLWLEKNVFLCGHVENAARYLKAFDIFTLTSITEGLAYVLIEAGQAALPVLASSTGGIPEIIAGDSFGILAQPRNIKDIALGIRTLLENAELRKTLGKNLHERVTKEFSFEMMQEQTTRLYKR